MLKGQLLQDDLHIIFVSQTIGQHFKLQHAHHSHYDFLHTGIKLLEYLDCTFLGNLVHTLYKLFALHGIHLAHPGKMLRRKGGYSLKLKLLIGSAQGIAYGENSRVEYADNIAGICLLHDFPVLGHELLGLGQTDLLSSLHMVYLHPCLELAGADAHKSNSVPVGFVHVGLDFKYKGGKVRAERVYHPVQGLPGKRRRSHFKEMLQKGLHSKIGQGRSEEHRGQIPYPDPLHI